MSVRPGLSAKGLYYFIILCAIVWVRKMCRGVEEEERGSKGQRRGEKEQGKANTQKTTSLILCDVTMTEIIFIFKVSSDAD